MFGRKKKKNVLDENAQLAQQLGISLPGMDIVLPKPADDESDEMLEAELLALMEEEEEEEHDERPTQSKRKAGSQAQKEADISEDDVNDEDLLAELAEIESQEIEEPPVTQREPQMQGGVKVAPQPSERLSQPPSSQQDSISQLPVRHHNPPSNQQTVSAGPQPAARLHNPPPQQQTYSSGPQPSARLHNPPSQQQTYSSAPQPSARLHNPPAHQQAPPYLKNISVNQLEDNRERLMASVPKQPIAPMDLAQLIEERITNYETALMNARTNQEGSKERRYNRGLQTLKDLQKKVKAGRNIPEADIPPEVAVGSVRQPEGAPQAAPVQTPTTVPASVPPTPALDENTYKLLCQRRDLYKMAAFKAKKENDNSIAMEHLKIVKQFEAVIAAVESGEQVDLSNMPPAPSEIKERMATESVPQQPIGVREEPAASSAIPDMPQPRSVLEGLMQRRERYKMLADKASSEDNASKSRRLGRIVKQYDDAVKKEKAGKPVSYEELPELPDFPPLPFNKAASNTATAVSPSPVPAARTQQPPLQTHPAKPPVREVTPEVAPISPPRKSVKEAMNERHLKILQQKKKKAMMMALQAKKQGDMEEAKRLLIIAKGFDPMIEAAENGLPVNMETIPKLPDEETVNAVSPPPGETPPEALALTGNRDEVYSRLISTLQKQIEQCKTLAQAYSELGNVQTAKRFQEYCQCSQEDKDLLTVSHQHNDPVPRFHYEQRTIPTVRVSPGLKKDEAEITIIKGLDYKNPAGGNSEDLDTFVKFEFPYPSDAPQTGHTGNAKGVEDVEYQSSHKVQVNLKARSFLSAVKRKQVKFEVMYHKGFLRGDKVLGTASLKLADLESKHEIHSSLPLCEGRKEIGGKLEVKLRVHHPLGGMKEEFTKEKWLVVDSKVGRQLSKGSGKSSPTKTPANKSKQSQVPDTIDVLKWEATQLRKKSAEIQAQGKRVPSELEATQLQMLEMVKSLERMIQNSKARQAYMVRLQSNEKMFGELARQAQQQNNKEKVALYMKKKQIVANEFARLSGH